MRDPAIAATPRGEEIDGRRLLGEAVLFGRELRRAGLAVDLAAAVDFARALGIVDVAEREQVRAAGEAVFTRRRDDREIYDAVFARFWRARRGTWIDERIPLEERSNETAPPDDSHGDAPPTPGSERLTADQERAGIPIPTEGEDDSGLEDAPDTMTISPDAYSKLESLRHRDFDRMTPAELRDAERLVDLLEPRLEKRRTRRYELHSHGRRLAPRSMFRRNLGTGGNLLTWVWRRPLKRARPLVVICDISGSMERHSRLLLRFIQALAAASTVKTESFVFGTRLTRVTRLMRDRDRDRALAKVSEAVTDWAGGTRIGESFRDFNLRWARRTLRSSGVVIVVSDGWDRGDPRLVATETARLRRNCHRLVWLNPLAGTPGYQPLAAGMKAAFPFIDDFLPAGTVASLERLGEILAGVRTEDTHRSSEAAASSTRTLGGSAAPSADWPPKAARVPSPDPTMAQPLEPRTPAT